MGRQPGVVLYPCAACLAKPVHVNKLRVASMFRWEPNKTLRGKGWPKTTAKPDWRCKACAIELGPFLPPDKCVRYVQKPPTPVCYECERTSRLLPKLGTFIVGDERRCSAHRKVQGLVAVSKGAKACADCGKLTASDRSEKCNDCKTRGRAGPSHMLDLLTPWLQQELGIALAQEGGETGTFTAEKVAYTSFPQRAHNATLRTQAKFTIYCPAHVVVILAEEASPTGKLQPGIEHLRMLKVARSAKAANPAIKGTAFVRFNAYSFKSGDDVVDPNTHGFLWADRLKELRAYLSNRMGGEGEAVLSRSAAAKGVRVAVHTTYLYHDVTEDGVWLARGIDQARELVRQGTRTVWECERAAPPPARKRKRALGA